MSRARIRLFAACAAGTLLGASAAADTLELRNGERLVGDYLGGSEQALRIETAEGVQVIPVVEVLTLSFDSGPPASAPTAKVAPRARRAAAPAVSPGAPATPAAPAPPASAQEAGLVALPDHPGTRPAAPAQTAVSAVHLPAGTRLRVRVTDTLDPRESAEGDRFSALLDAPLAAAGRPLLPAHTRLYGVVTAAQLTGPPANRLQLELTELQLGGRAVAIVTGTQQRVARVPAAPANAAAQVAARVPSGALLEFRLLQPVALPVAR